MFDDYDSNNSFDFGTRVYGRVYLDDSGDLLDAVAFFALTTGDDVTGGDDDID